ncbi:MAG: TSUP family transporter [Byssovorax sp.]
MIDGSASAPASSWCPLTRGRGLKRPPPRSARPRSSSAAVVTWPELAPSETSAWTAYCNAKIPGHEDHPINCVDWTQAELYCRVHGHRLPTEAEFEFAARGGDEERVYPWGSDPVGPTRLNACGTECQAEVSNIRQSWFYLYDGNDGYPGTAPVGSFPAGAGRWGHLDLAGNVWEWCSTLYCPYGSPDCWTDERCARGSGFLQVNEKKTRATRRNRDPEWHSGGDLGFRCASSYGPNPPPPSTSPGFTLEHHPPGTAAWWVLLLLSMALVGFAGWVLGFLGGGGSVLMVPIMLFVVGLEQRSAAVLALVVVSATSAVSALSHARAGRLRLRTALLFGPVATAGAFAGGRLAQYVPFAVILAGFVVLMLATARAMLRKKPPSKAPPGTPPAPERNGLRAAVGLVVIGTLVGMISGMLGIGAGLIVVPALTLLFDLELPVAVGTSAAIILGNSIAGYIGQSQFIPVDWRLALPFSAAAVTGTIAGSLRTGRVSPERLRRLFGVLVIGASLLVLFRQALPGIRDLVRARQADLARRGGG